MKNVLVGLVVLLSITAFVNAAEEAAAQDLGVTVDLSYTTKYIWRGYDILDDVGAWQPSVDVDLGGGFSANVWMSYAGSSGMTNSGSSRVDLTEYDYTLAYGNTVLEDSVWKTDYSVGYRYYDYPKRASTYADMQEIFIEAAMPALVGDGVTPRIAWYQMWEGSRDLAGGGGVSGDIFDLGLDYDFALDQAPELPMTFSWDIVYNDGVLGGDHDWSHMVWGLSTSMTCPATGGTLTPAIYFQNTWEDTVNTEDEFWAAISYSFSF